MEKEEVGNISMYDHIKNICGILKNCGIPRQSYIIKVNGRTVDLRGKTSIGMSAIAKLLNHINNVYATMYLPAIESRQNMKEPIHLRFIFLGPKQKLKPKKRMKLKMKAEDPLMGMAHLSAFDMK